MNMCRQVKLVEVEIFYGIIEMDDDKENWSSEVSYFYGFFDLCIAKENRGLDEGILFKFYIPGRLKIDY